MSSDGTLSDHSRSPSPGGVAQSLTKIPTDREIEAALGLIGMKQQGDRPQEQQPQGPATKEAPLPGSRPIPVDWIIEVSLVGSGTRDGKDWYCQLFQGTQTEGYIWNMGTRKEVQCRFKKSGKYNFFAMPTLQNDASDADLKGAFGRAGGKHGRFMGSAPLRLKRAQTELQQAKIAEQCWESDDEVADAAPRLHLQPWMSKLVQAFNFRNEGTNHQAILSTDKTWSRSVPEPEGACAGKISEQEGSLLCEVHITERLLPPKDKSKKAGSKKAASSAAITNVTASNAGPSNAPPSNTTRKRKANTIDASDTQKGQEMKRRRTASSPAPAIDESLQDSTNEELFPAQRLKLNPPKPTKGDESENKAPCTTASAPNNAEQMANCENASSAPEQAKKTLKRRRGVKNATSAPPSSLTNTKQTSNDENASSAAGQVNDVAQPAPKKRRTSNKRATSPQTLLANKSQQKINDKGMISTQAAPTTQQLNPPLRAGSTISPDHLPKTSIPELPGRHGDLSSPKVDGGQGSITSAQKPEVQSSGTPITAAPEVAQTPTANIPASAPVEGATPAPTTSFGTLSMNNVVAGLAFFNESDLSYMRPPPAKSKKPKGQGTKIKRSH